MTSHKSPKGQRKKAQELGPPLMLPEGDPADLAPEHLLLDPQNLRLLEVSEGLVQTPAKLIGQPSIQDRVWHLMKDNTLFDVDPLVKSIEYNGFLKHEQLVVAPFDGETSLVLEGNRRLTAVRAILKRPEAELDKLPPAVRQSLMTMPCFVLRGDSISGSEERLNYFRRASELYIGLRHLMGAKSWEPASRYEFVWRLISEGWSVQQVAERFGREVPEVRRDLKAQTLFRDYHDFEVRRGIPHAITYNAFAEAARAGSIMKWLGWSNSAQRVENKDNEEGFFGYLISKLRSGPLVRVDEESDSPAESAEAAVRKLREMLKLDDEDIRGALTDKQFDQAESMYEDRKEGEFAKRLQTYIRVLKRTTVTEVAHNLVQNKELLAELQKQSGKLIRIIDGILAD